MIRLHLDNESLRSIRLALSPLWETLGSLALFARYRGAVPSPYASWMHYARRSVQPEVMGPLLDLTRRQEAAFLKRAYAYIPDPSRTTLSAELNFLRQDGNTPGEEQLVDLLEQYWHGAIGPYWNSIRTSLEEEVLFRARTLAVGGPEAMLAELGGRVHWQRPTLTAPYHLDLTRSVARAQLVLIPSVFSGGTRMFTVNEPTIAMSYQARASGFLPLVADTKSDEESKDRLALLIGTGRARIMRALEMPKTTTAVAQSLGLAKSTVSQHLAVLTSAELVWRQRLGGRVFYQLDHSGFALLEQLGD
ncbi:ArsR/SmtB family transcription factor [Streptomyces phyllanthi]|uniref:Helix-turn-helix transcriptional regulator n=1 Tax=Streptomyces phyllanthi TaxID=1803180 RepID=A0A5N8VVA7_9ACTN|nr:helix-turn-helix domain-containing protein [Streptomyces phyllanthi]MPY38606.1 helix-turn-helix transcriptional regulator [Streptomyces phyllanthi]